VTQPAAIRPTGQEPPPDSRFEVEPSSRWVRVELGGAIIADSKRVLLLREHGQLPVYCFPMADVRMELLTPAATRAPALHGEASFWSVRVGQRVVTDAAWAYLEPGTALRQIAGHVAFAWDLMDHWYEEAEEVFAHPRDPYARVDALASIRQVRVVVDGITVADSNRSYLLFETGAPTRYYVPPADVRMELLTPTEAHTRCPYKGLASYWSVQTGERIHENLAWSYADPIPECPKIRGLIAFFNEKVDLFVDGELQERPATKWRTRRIV
jgi:uncharacterized protein (DUF427 family)